MHFRCAGIGKTHLDALLNQRLQEFLCSIHLVSTPKITKERVYPSSLRPAGVNAGPITKGSRVGQIGTKLCL
jgi:hypothetical protein